MNALELPVTNCHVGMNKQGLPIGIQVSYFFNSLLMSSLFPEAMGYCQDQ
jgi:hypothetical protein